MGTARSVDFMYRDGRRKSFYDGKGHMGLVPDLALGRAVGQLAAATPAPCGARARG